MDAAPLLFNCTGDDVYVKIGDEYVLLPEAPAPRLLYTSGEPEPVTFRVPTVFDPVGGPEVSLDAYQSNKVFGVLDAPAVLPGVRYLVDADAIRQFPFRDDFVAPAMWTMRIERPDNDEDVFPRVLVGVTRNVDVAASPDMGIIDWLAADSDEWDDTATDADER